MMITSRTPVETVAQVEVLFAPVAVSIVDIFRALGDFEEHYDLAALDRLEANLARTMSRDDAKGVVSDALLLAFSLRRERCKALDFAPLRSRRGTLDEYRLLALVGATYWHDFELASEAAASLGIVHDEPPISLAFDIARRLEAAGLTIEAPDARMLGRTDAASPVEVTETVSGNLKLHFDF